MQIVGSVSHRYRMGLKITVSVVRFAPKPRSEAEKLGSSPVTADEQYSCRVNNRMRGYNGLSYTSAFVNSIKNIDV